MIATTLIVAALASAAMAANGAPATRYLAFGPHGSDWLLVEVASRRVERVTIPAGKIEGLAVSSDGIRFAYVGPASNDTQGLWSWNRGDAAPTLIDSGAGKYSDPAIAPDGRIYFSRSPVNGRQHTFGTYAQVFRIRSDGANLQQVTDENGCHFGASFTSRGRLQYIHTSCRAQSWVERVGTAPRPETLVSVIGSLAEATTSPDGNSVLFVSDQPDSFMVQEVRGKGQPRMLFALDRQMDRVRPAYGRSSHEIFYQQGGKVWRLSKGVRAVVAALDGGDVQ